MAASNMDLRETHTIGSRTRERLVSAQTCPALAGHGISMCGISDAETGFRFVRHRPAMSQLLACVSGEGRAWVDGTWVRCGPTEAYLTPHHLPHAYHAAGAWRVVWLHLPEQEVRGPAIISADPQPLYLAVEGLHREAIGACDPAIMQNWATLVALLARRVIGHLQIDPRLERLWERVDQKLAQAWSNGGLAELAGVSCEHLRRLCLAQIGTSPMRHLTHLRMRRADALLRTGAYSVHAVAELVGYSDPFAFSTAFRRQFGVAPSSLIPRA